MAERARNKAHGAAKSEGRQVNCVVCEEAAGMCGVFSRARARAPYATFRRPKRGTAAKRIVPALFCRLLSRMRHAIFF